MNLISNLLVGGIVTGCIYALVAIGFVVLYRATRVFSLAQGSFMVLGATLLYTLEQHGLSLFWAGLASVAATAVLGAAVYFFLFSGRLLSAEPLTVAIATIALSTLLSMIVVLIWERIRWHCEIR
jgi:branched-subunit amino acid ABC-type transport system permease component